MPHHVVYAWARVYMFPNGMLDVGKSFERKVHMQLCKLMEYEICTANLERQTIALQWKYE